MPFMRTRARRDIRRAERELGRAELALEGIVADLNALRNRSVEDGTPELRSRFSEGVNATLGAYVGALQVLDELPVTRLAEATSPEYQRARGALNSQIASVNGENVTINDALALLAACAYPWRDVVAAYRLSLSQLT